MTPQTGKVYLIGAGPGDPGLITVKGRDALRRADVVVYDRLAHPALLDYAPGDAERVFAGKGRGRQALTFEKLAENDLTFPERLASRKLGYKRRYLVQWKYDMHPET